MSFKDNMEFNKNQITFISTTQMQKYTNKTFDLSNGRMSQGLWVGIESLITASVNKCNINVLPSCIDIRSGFCFVYVCFNLIN